MSWAYLIAATLLDVIATIAMKQSEGFSKIMPTIIAVITFAMSICALALALQKLDITPVYLIWVGLGSAIITVVGVMVYHETISFLKIASIILIVAGVIGISVSSKTTY